MEKGLHTINMQQQHCWNLDQCYWVLIYLTIYTGHKNLTFEKLQTQRVIRWRLFVEEYSPKLIYIEGEKTAFYQDWAESTKLQKQQKQTKQRIW